MDISNDPIRGSGIITVASGRKIDVFNMKVEDVNVQDIAHALALICRFAGHVSTFYSVAEHCTRMSLARCQSKYLSRIILLHDAAEAYVGDMMRPLKYINQVHSVIKPIENGIQEIIHKAFNITVSDEDLASVKILDDEMLATEIRDVFPNFFLPSKLPCPYLTRPLDIHIHAWDWRLARDRFLIRARELDLV